MGIYDKKGCKHLNLQENVLWNTDQIIKLKEIIEGLNISYIEIDDNSLEGTGDLTEEQVNILKNKTYVYVLLKRNDRNEEEEQPVLMFFDGEKYQEGNTIIKSMSAGGYARVISFDLDNAVWNYYESDEDLEALAQRVSDLENDKLDKSEAESTYATKEELAEKQDAIQYIELYNSSGSITDEQLAILQASELNYIWYHGMHRLTFRYKNVNNTSATYASNDKRQYHSIEIDLTLKRYEAYDGYCEGQLNEGDNVTIDRNTDPDYPTISVNSTSIITVAPTEAYTGGGIKFVHLASSEGVTEYNGYIYMYDED